MLTDENVFWISFLESPGIGPKRFLQLHSRLQEEDRSFEFAWGLKKKQLIEFGFSEKNADLFIQHRESFDLSWVKKTIKSVNAQIVTFQDDHYPNLLQDLPDKPPILYLQGSLQTQMNLPIAVVGTRRCTEYGRLVTEKIVSELVQHSSSIISGFMYGIDAVAHQTTIEHLGYTVAVLGYGFQHFFPASTKHKRLYTKILDAGGAFVTEFFPERPPIPANFPLRNRIVAGMSLGVVVAQAAVKSGSRITAECALEYNREVFAVPGPITCPYSEGTKDLINQGAKLVQGADDILDEFPLRIQVSPTQQKIRHREFTDEVERRIMEVLSDSRLDCDELAKQTSLPIYLVLSKLSVLELKGAVCLYNGRYQLSFDP